MSGSVGRNGKRPGHHRQTRASVRSTSFEHAHLEQVLEAEKALVQRGELPCKSTALSSAEALAAECPTPQMRRKTLKTLGTPTVQAAALSSDVTELSADDVLAAALRKRASSSRPREKLTWSATVSHMMQGKGPHLIVRSWGGSSKYVGVTGIRRRASQSTYGAKAKLCR